MEKQRLLTALREIWEELPDLVGKASWPAFDRELEGYLKQFEDHPEQDARTQEQVLQLLACYPQAHQRLLALTGESILEEAEEEKPMTEPQPEPTPQLQKPETPAERQERQQGVLMIVKEALTGCIGLLVVGTTLLLVLVTLLAVLTRPAADVTGLKEVLLFMNGLIGVVLGYYFGRVPAEARARAAEAGEAEAQEKAGASQEQLAEVRGGLETLRADVAQRRQSPIVRGSPADQELADLEARLDRLLDRVHR